MVKEIMEQQGKSLVFWMRDVMSENEILKLPFEYKVLELLARAHRKGDFNDFTEEECKVVLLGFVEPVAWRDIELKKINSIYVSVDSACQLIWHGLPVDIRNTIRNSK